MNRVVASVACVVLASTAVAGPPLTDSGAGRPKPRGPQFFVQAISSPAEAAEQWRVFLETSVRPEDRPFMFAQWWGALADQYRQFVTLYRIYIQTVNNQSALVHSLPVPGTGNQLWFYDIRLAGQTTAGRAAVCRRDKVFRETTFIPHATAEGIRRLQGTRADVTTFHVDSIVPGPWFLRQVMQPKGKGQVTNFAYYDLLYSTERFGAEVFPTFGKGAGPVAGGGVSPPPGGTATLPPEPQQPPERPWPGGVWPKDGQPYKAGEFNYVPKEEWDAYQAALATWKVLKAGLEAAPQKVPLPAGQVFLEAKVLKDFPTNLDDFEARWGDKAIEDFLDKVKIKTNNGEVVAGITDDPKNGSIVSYHNRLLKFGGNPFNNGTSNMSTKDFFDSTGKNNLADRPKDAVFNYRDIQEDGGEHLYGMPNGFPAVLITGAAKDKRPRVEAADGELVRSSQDPHHGTVFAQYSCHVCHGPSNGVLTPGNRLVGGEIDRIGRGPGVKNDPFSANVIREFFTRYERKLPVWRAAYGWVLQEMTATEADPKGWDGARFSKETVDFIGWYDFPLSLAQASAETGIPKLGLMLLALLDGSRYGQALFFDEGVPREVWDVDLMPRLAAIYAALKTADLDPASPEGMLFRMFLPDLLKQVPTYRGGK